MCAKKSSARLPRGAWKTALQLNELFDKLLARRQQVAVNAGFENYRDYKFRELGRFDYGPEDCFRFHEAVREHISRCTGF